MKGNFILQETTTSGTGALTLTGVTNCGTFAGQFSTNALFKYLIRNKATKIGLETGWGYLDGSGDLVRSIIESTNASGTVTNGGTALNLPGGTTYEVLCGETAGIGLAAAPGAWAPANGVTGYGDTHSQGSSSTLSLVADTVYVLPFIRSVDRMVDAITASITVAAAAGKTMKAAIFTIASDGKPGTKVAESAAVAADVTGLRHMTFSSAVRVPDRFFVALLCDGSPTLLAYGTAVTGPFSLGYNAQLAAICAVTHAGATGLTYPASWTLTAVLSNAARPALVARCI